MREDIRPREDHSLPTSHEPSDDLDSFLRLVARTEPPARTPAPGERLGGPEHQRFELLEELGRGGMGLVFRAWDAELQREVALKFLLARQGQAESALREARAIARLDHENIIRIFDMSMWRAAPGEPAVPFLVMEYLEGAPLAPPSRTARPELGRALELLDGICAGLMHAHERHLIHRDLKPSNVFLTASGTVKLLDFGLAEPTVSRDTPGPRLPRAGTPAYMAPEQWRGEALDERTDIWALGVLTYELLTGTLPHPGVIGADALRAWVLSDAPMPSLHELRPDLPWVLKTLVGSALTKEPSQRLPSVREFRDTLREVRERRVPRGRAPGPEAPQRRQVTLVSCRLANLPEDLDPEELGELEAAFHRGCKHVIEQHEGSIALALGDEVLACFGYPLAREGNSERAVRAGLHLVRELPGLLHEGRSAVKVGIHTDTVAFDADSLSAIQGEAPKVAAWLARQAEPHTVWLSGTTWTLVHGAFEADALGTRAFEGALKTSSVDSYRLRDERRTGSRFERALASGPLTPLVGREHELRWLQERWEEARRGHGAFVLLSGEPGLGKSRLLEELHQRVAPASALRLRCQCWSQSSTSALHPLLQVLPRLLRLEPEESPERRRRQLEAAWEHSGLSPEEVRARTWWLASLLSLPMEPPPHVRHFNPERRKEETFEALAELLLLEASRQPVLLLIEDLHWADASTLQFLGFLLERIPGAPLLVLLSTRPDFQPSWPRHAWLHSRGLERLSADLTAALVREVAGARELPEETVLHLVARTDGIPLFVEEMTRMVLVRAGAEDWRSPPVPLTLHELLLARLDMLPHRQKELVQLCAVVGRTFTQALIALLSKRDEHELRQDFAGMVKTGLLQTQEELPEPGYQFRHALIQDAAYQSLTRGTRRRHHGRIAHALAERFPTLAEAQPELLAHHYTEAGEPEPAIHHWTRAGVRAKQRSADVEAVSHFSRALELLRGLPDAAQRTWQELQLVTALGLPLAQVRSYKAPEVERVFERMRQLLQGFEERTSQLDVSYGALFHYEQVRARLDSTQRLARQLVSRAEPLQASELLAKGHLLMAVTSLNRGELATAQEHCERVLAVTHAPRPRTADKEWFWLDSRSSALAQGAMVQALLGNPEQCLRYTRQGERRVEEVGHLFTTTHTLAYLAVASQFLRDVRSTLELAERCLTLSREHRLRFWLGCSTFTQAWALAELGQVRESLELMRQQLARWRGLGIAFSFSRKLAMVAELHLKLGESEEGLALVSEGLAHSAATGEHYYDAELYRLQGELRRLLGQRDAARDGFLRALATARRQRAGTFELRAAVSLGRLLRDQGASEAVRALLTPLCERFAPASDFVDLREARELLT